MQGLCEALSEGTVSKYYAQPSLCAKGHKHASKREAKRCNELHLLLRAGEIESLEQQPQYWFVINGQTLKHPNGSRVGYQPDFRYIDRLSGATIVEDSKGVKVRDYPLRAAIFRALHPDLILREV